MGSSRRLLAAGLATAVVAGIGGGSAFAYANLKSRADRLQAALTADLQAGQMELEAGKASLTEANAKHDASLISQALGHFAAAKAQFLTASRRADNSQLLHYLEEIPGAGSFVYSRHTTVDRVAEMGAALSEAGKELCDLDAQLIKPPGSGPAINGLLTTLEQAQATLVRVRLNVDRARRAAEQVDVQILPSGQQKTFVKARDAIAKAESGLDEFQRLVPVLKDVLGGNGTRMYLIEQVNPAELRAGGGFIGTYSLVRADNGTLAVITSGDAYDLANPRAQPGQPGFIPQPSPLREITPNTPWSFVDSNVYPDFPSNAKAAISFAQPRIGTKIDGVISMDYYTVAKMLDLTGPLRVPGYDLTVDSNNFVAQVIRIDLNDSAHKAMLSAIAGPLMARVSALPPDRWPALIGALNTLAAEHSLQVYFVNDLVEKEIERVGWSGRVNPTGAADYMMEVESNYSGDKVNYYTSRHYTLVLTRNRGMLHHKLTVDLVNWTPSGSFVFTHYDANVRLYVGALASGASSSLKPVKYANPPPPRGTMLLDGWLDRIHCCGAMGQATFEYDTRWTSQGNEVARIYWQKQPGTVADKTDVTWIDTNGDNFNVSGDLAQDRIISLSPKGVTLSVGQPGQAALPSLSFG